MRQWWFWVNYVFILAVTSWMPLLNQTVTMVNGDGAVLKQEVVSVRAWKSWYLLFSRGHESGQLQPVAMHVGLCFIVAALVWSLMFRPVIPDSPGPAADTTPDEDAPSSGDAPHE